MKDGLGFFSFWKFWIWACIEGLDYLDSKGYWLYLSQGLFLTLFCVLTRTCVFIDPASIWVINKLEAKGRKETLFNSTKAPASGFSAQSFIKQVLLPLFPHSSWGASSWPCLINHKASEPSLCCRETVPPFPRTDSTQETAGVQIWSCDPLGWGIFAGASFFFFSFGIWWYLLGGHREMSPNLMSKKSHSCVGGGSLLSSLESLASHCSVMQITWEVMQGKSLGHTVYSLIYSNLWRIILHNHDITSGIRQYFVASVFPLS